ncbi:FTR1 family iron permease [Pseudomonas sp. FW306-02-F02-AA]|uniref:FTR1 family iron permease n=1 Tax=Pseudomonas fluorescens TaxID=294 RepID=A0A0N9VYE3_PSEFL|nr:MULTISPECIES: FTR1 family protein [Pseudomonas]ALI03639.1 FTR1 family iron permease [Pseudomonas fluorescens]PMZ02050.1 FTR1 family iron permease [Pseudomonas sp. FW306-02-F02-AB]PMZ08061.1 FTR1 family iron permease [Pseudomonas sp. FW306-02-H06C]PMZ14719.1 FTR1 family iron permease [Pseudomonas sp. FW306-02-F02-AA]PMZ20696.1 DNA translocase FtsK [Pseudomonas sp. FW306-02-F08-AA]
MNQSMFIVWRESVEALLVIGILQAWTCQQGPGNRLVKYLWAGVMLGLMLSGLLAVLILFAGEAMSGSASEWFQAALALIASLLMVQMVGWMHRNGRTLKFDLRRHADSHLARRGGLGLLLLAMLAVGREGSETVVFLYGAGARLRGPQLGLFAVGGVMGLVLSALTLALLHSSRRFISWQRFFAISEVVLLMLGAALLVSGTERIGGQLLVLDFPELVYSIVGDALWDTSTLLNDSHGLGGFLASFAGYRATPSGLTLLVWVGYWLVVGGWLRQQTADNLPCPT